MTDSFDDPSLTIEIPFGPGVIEGTLSPGVGDTLLMKFFSEGLSGRLFLEGAPAPRGVLFFIRGEPVHSEPAGGLDELVKAFPGVSTLGQVQTVRAAMAHLARAGVAPVRLIELLRDNSRRMIRDLLGAQGGTYRFKLEEPPDDLPLVAVNPFGQLLDARRKRLRPDELFRVGEERANQVPFPRPGFSSVAVRIRPFTGGIDLSRVIDGTATAASVYSRIGLPPIVGGLIFDTLSETGLLRWQAEPGALPVRESFSVSTPTSTLTMSEDAMPLAELQSLPHQAQLLLSLYFDLKPERDPKVLFGPDAVRNVGALERGYEERLAQIDPRLVPAGVGRPYLLARVEELRGKLERAYKQLAPEHATERKGAFVLFERIGVGGVAEVYRAKSNADGAVVAVKRMRPETRDQIMLVRELLREARVIQRIRHPNVVRVLNAGKSGDDFYLAMEYVDGGDLQSLLNAADKINARSVDVFCTFVADACGGLHAAHRARDDHGAIVPILHRDVSPHNILVTKRGEAKLTDFGIARVGDRSASDSRTDPGTIRGKLPYIAPELISDQGVATVRSDIYAMGMTLYALFAQLPFKRKTPPATLRAILEDALPTVSSLNADVPIELDPILQRACARDPAQRYQSALELQIDLEQYLARRPKVDAASWVQIVLDDAAVPELPTDTSSSVSTGLVQWSDIDVDL